MEMAKMTYHTRLEQVICA